MLFAEIKKKNQKKVKKIINKWNIQSQISNSFPFKVEQFFLCYNFKKKENSSHGMNDVTLFWTLFVSANFSACMWYYLITLEMACSSHLTLLYYLNWWTLVETKGPSPVSWPMLEPLSLLLVKGGSLTSCAAGILLYVFIRLLPQCRLVNYARLSTTSLYCFLCTLSQ